MDTDRAPTAAPTLAYATPGDEPPRPTAALWVATTLVWTGSVSAMGSGLIAAFLALIAGEVGTSLIALFIVGLAVRAVIMEWEAVVKRSLDSASTVSRFASFVALASVVGGGIALLNFAISVRPLSDRLFGPAIVVGVFGFSLFVACTHASWEQRLRSGGVNEPQA